MMNKINLFQLDWGQSFCPFFNTSCPLVAAYPVNWNFMQRLNFYKAAQLNGNKNLSLLRETSALAIHYYFHRLSRTNLDKPLKILFIDSGHSETKTAYVIYSAKEIKILGHDVFPDISGLKLDKIICNYLANKYNLIPTDNLINISERLKKNISLNQKSEYYCEQNDINFTLDRERIFKNNRKLLEIFSPVYQILDVDTIEIVN